MNTPEMNLQQRLAAIIETAHVNPFAKVASTDAQLALIADSLDDASQAAAPPVATPRTAPRVLSLADIMKHAAFHQGFAAAYGARKEEIEEAFAKIAGAQEYGESIGRYATRLGASARAVGREVARGLVSPRQASDRAKTYGAVAAATGAVGALKGAYRTRKANAARPADQKKSVLAGAAKGAVKGTVSGAGGAMAADALMRARLKKSSS